MEEQLKTEFNKRTKSLKLNEQAKEELFNKLKACWESGFRCFYCKRRMDLKFENEYSWTIEHFIPRAKGGKDEAENIEFVCRACNFLKGEMNPKQYINTRKRLKLRKEKMEYWKARKSSRKDEQLREAYKGIFEMRDAKREEITK